MDTDWTVADDGSETVDLALAVERLPNGDTHLVEASQGGDGGSWTRWLGLSGAEGGRHPWFLVSGMLMFVGCYLVNAAVHQRPDELAPVLALVGVFMLYEWLVLGLGLWLWRRTSGGEAGQLLGLAVLLLADTTFVYNELAIADLALGAGVGFFAATVGVFKLAVVARVAGLRLGRSGWGAAVLGVALAFGLPVAARAVGGTGGLPGWLPTAAWWAAAGLIALTLWALSDPRRREAGGRLSGLVIGLPAVSAVLHLLAIHWVYHEAWTAAHLSPVLLGLSVVLLARGPWGAALPRWTAGVCGVIGVWTATGADGQVVGWGWVEFDWSVFRGWLLAAGVGYGVVWWRRRSLVLLVVWPTSWLLAGLGASPGLIARRVGTLMDGTWQTAETLMPKGLLSWGVMVIGLAFATLGVGAWLSGRRREGDST